MQAAKAVKEAEAAEQKQAQDIRTLEEHEQSVLDEHRFVSTQRGKLQKELNQVTEEAQASRCCSFPKHCHAAERPRMYMPGCCVLMALCRSPSDDVPHSH